MIFEFDNSGTFIGGSSIFANARDYARFGYLYLRDGLWDGERIVSKEWIDDTRIPAKNSHQMYSNQFWMPIQHLHVDFQKILTMPQVLAGNIY